MMDTEIRSSDPSAPRRQCVNRERLLRWYERNRARTAALFALIGDEAYYARPIPARLPIVFYEGHLPVFSFNTLVKRALGRPSIDARLEELFARGIDPAETAASATPEERLWPTRTEVQSLAAEADRQVREALIHANIEQPGHPLLDRAEAAFCLLEHEAMHQETLLYMLHRLPHEMKRRPEDYKPVVAGRTPARMWVDVPEGQAVLGLDAAREDFTWDNERPAHAIKVKAFRIERHNVTNEDFMNFVDDGGYREPRWWRPVDWDWVNSHRIAHPSFWARRDRAWFWNGLFDLIPLPPSWPVYVSQAEASAFARWRGLRLPTEPEYVRAAFGSPRGGERHFPWGLETPAVEHGVFDFSAWEPEPAGTHPRGASAWGVEDLMGNGWEWTSTVFEPFPGFTPLPSYPEYSADFFDGEHFVMKGASPATAREILRPSFRNWFRPRYPYVYATFRCVDDRARETGRRRAS
jgi:iron(II)-dependent oxidoreductase